jgi:glycosyltransferase involved in cell wall biosynthesis
MFNGESKDKKDIVIFSHLRWDFVTQRPQHIATRLGKDRKILFVEEPIEFENEDLGSANVVKVNENITVIQPKISAKNFSKELSPLVNFYLSKWGIIEPILWFYSASFVDVVDSVDHSLLVYDCMDELSAFKGASKNLIAQEKKLLNLSDVVFTGGKSLYESKRKHNINTHCFPSSVEKYHFEKAYDLATVFPPDIERIPKPVVGFYGVIDERIDLNLLEKVARKMPYVSFVMIGPVAKIKESSLPKASNIYYLGEKSYEELPNYLKAFEIAMMPFAINRATEFISPTKTLEFMAARKSIISTPVYDVVRDYQRVVEIAEDATEFEQAIKNYLTESQNEKKTRETLQDYVIEKTSWDKTVLEMEKIIERRIDSRNLEEAEYSLMNVI